MSRLILVEKPRSISKTRYKSLLYEAIKISAGIALMVLGAKARFILPFTGIPFTLQTFSLTLIILLFNERAPAVLSSYLILGLLGAPVFALGGGPFYLLSLTFGYLLGFVIASLWGYWVSNKIHKPSRYLLLILLVILTVYALGFAWLTVWLVAVTGLGVAEALARAFLMGIAPFILWDILKGYMALPIFFSIKLSHRRYKQVFR